MDDTTQAPRTGESMSHGDIMAIVVGVCVAMFLGALDQTIIAAALPTIAHDLGDFADISWVASIYLLTATAVTPLYGKFSDMHGRRSALMIAIAVFLIGSIGSAMAPTMLFLIASRAAQGLGGGGLISLAQTIIGDIVAPKERGRYQIYFASVYLLASLVGPMLGGFLTEHVHWSFIFWINLPLGAIAYLISGRALKRLPRNDRPHKLDVGGALLMVGATVTLMVALDYSGNGLSWLSAPIIAMAVSSVLLWLGFGWRITTAAEPLIPPVILANPVVSMGTASACFGMGTYIALSIYTPLYFQVVRGLSTSDSGLALIPLMAGTVVGATIAGQLMGRITHYKVIPVIGLMVAMTATLSLAFFDTRLTLTEFEAVLMLISIGLGTLLPTTTVAIQNAVPLHQLGTTTGIMNFFRQLGSALLVAIFGVLLLSGGHHGHGAAAVEAVAKSSFFSMFMATFGGFFFAFVFVVAMKEQPLRSGAREAAGAVIAD